MNKTCCEKNLGHTYCPKCGKKQPSSALATLFMHLKKNAKYHRDIVTGQKEHGIESPRRLALAERWEGWRDAVELAIQREQDERRREEMP
jgi:hypothetical protein